MPSLKGLRELLSEAGWGPNALKEERPSRGLTTSGLCPGARAGSGLELEAGMAPTEGCARKQGSQLSFVVSLLEGHERGRGGAGTRHRTSPRDVYRILELCRDRGYKKLRLKPLKSRTELLAGSSRW